jgi:hypothetical protein
MSQAQSKYYTYQQASLSQKVSHNLKILRKLSGTDREISDSIAVITYLVESGAMDEGDAKFVLGLLDVLRLSHLATSEKINEITKLGFMLPRADVVIDTFDGVE